MKVIQADHLQRQLLGQDSVRAAADFVVDGD